MSSAQTSLGKSLPLSHCREKRETFLGLRTESWGLEAGLGFPGQRPQGLVMGTGSRTTQGALRAKGGCLLLRFFLPVSDALLVGKEIF